MRLFVRRGPVGPDHCGQCAMMRTYLVTYRFGHHYAASGYNRLGEFVPCTRIALPEGVARVLRRRATVAAAAELKSTTGLLGYFPECRLLERCVSVCATMPGTSLFHFVYPENSYYFSGQHVSRRTRLVATYHQPAAECREFILKTEAIRRLDAVILLSESQREFFEPLVGSSRVHVVPHGIDLGFFHPADRVARAPRVLVVGSWLRDLDTMAATLAILEQSAPHVAFDVVTAAANRSRFDTLSNVTFHTGITDADLLGLYHRATVAALPLSGAAANNALLEAMACGLPIVATDLPAVREYTTSEGARYVPRSRPDLFADTIGAVLDAGEGELRRMGQANRRHAERFSWPTVARQTVAVYESCQ